MKKQYGRPRFRKITEQPSRYRHLEKKNTRNILLSINREDRSVPGKIKKLIPLIEILVDNIADRMLGGGRLFYIGSGTSGRLGVVDASECPPTFGVSPGLVVGIIAGGDRAIRKAKEFAEDDPRQGWKDLQASGVNPNDTVIGLSASGTTPYVVGALQACRKRRIPTACITCNPGSPVTSFSDIPVEIPVGPEFITGSTRMKGGTAEKLILNMISTGVMIRLGRVKDNRMVDMRLSNRKLIDRGTRMVMEALSVGYGEANRLLLECGSVRKAIASKKH